MPSALPSCGSMPLCLTPLLCGSNTYHLPTTLTLYPASLFCAFFLNVSLCKLPCTGGALFYLPFRGLAVPCHILHLLIPPLDTTFLPRSYSLQFNYSSGDAMRCTLPCLFAPPSSTNARLFARPYPCPWLFQPCPGGVGSYTLLFIFAPFARCAYPFVLPLLYCVRPDRIICTPVAPNVATMPSHAT